MRKIFVIIISLLLAISFAGLAATPVHAYVSTHWWIAPFYRGYDEFYGQSVTAYKSGQTAQLLVSVYNDWYRNIFVTAVKVWFDWNINYSSTETPYVMKPGETRNFMINFTVPNINVASNMMTHRYRIYVEFVYDSSPGYWSDYGQYFAVYSADQADAQELYRQLQAFRSTSPPLFISSHARTSWLKAQVESQIGETCYVNGDFTSAKTHYQNALNLYNQAIDSEAERGTALEDALANLMNSFGAQAQAFGAQAQAYMILCIGIFISSILIGVGVIIYALAKRKMALAKTTS